MIAKGNEMPTFSFVIATRNRSPLLQHALQRALRQTVEEYEIVPSDICSNDAMPDGSVVLVEIERQTLSRVHPNGAVSVVTTLGGGPNGAAIGPDGGFSVVRLVAGALRNPRERFPELMRLKQRTAIASKKLGDFLAACTF